MNPFLIMNIMKGATRHKYLKNNKNKTLRRGGGKKRRTTSSFIPTHTPCHPKIGRLNHCLHDPQTLEKMRQRFNAQYPSQPIVTNESISIWNALRNAFYDKCKEREKCWVQQLNNPVNPNDYFVPPHPSSWKMDPNTWLTNHDIQHVLKQYETACPDFQSLGPTPIDFDKRSSPDQCVDDMLCHFELDKWLSSSKTKFGIVFNLSPHTEEGSHWVAQYMDIDPNVANHRMVFYFDSNGEGTPRQIRKFNTKILKQAHQAGFPIHPENVHVNKKAHQKTDTECGMYVLYFIITMLTGKDGGMGRDMTLDERKSLFLGTQGRLPDEIVEKKRHEYFTHAGGNL
jgi:hypothetical protein